LESTIEALKIGKQEGLTTILNTAPALHLPSEIYPFIDILCANETELEVLSGKKVDNVDAAIAASRDIIELGAKQVLITLGSKGCLLVTSDSTTYKAITKTVKAVDTTGAGDCFLGAFAYFLAQGSPIEICMERANVIAGYSVQKEGTQTSYPTRSELPSELFA
jgi:ribokinase